LSNKIYTRKLFVRKFLQDTEAQADGGSLGMRLEGEAPEKPKLHQAIYVQP